LAPTSIDIAALSGADDLADHDAAHRVVGGPGDAVDKAGERQMPHREPAEIGEHREPDGCCQHDQQDGDQRDPPLDPLDPGADDRAKQRHRQHAQHRHQGDVERRAGVLIDKDADDQHLQPAHREGDDPDHPQATEIGARERAPTPRTAPALGAGEDGGRPRRDSLARTAKGPQQQLVQTHLYTGSRRRSWQRLLRSGTAA